MKAITFRNLCAGLTLLALLSLAVYRIGFAIPSPIVQSATAGLLEN